MNLILSPKPTLTEFIATCTPLTIIDSLENDYQQRVATIADSLLAYTAISDPIQNLARFLQTDPAFLGIVLALTNLSQEKFLRILSAERFALNDYASEWGTNKIFRKLKNEAGFAERIAKLFIEGNHSPLLEEHVASFYLDQLSLPSNWANVIRDRSLVQGVIRRKLTGEYNDRKGDAIETIIRQKLDVTTAQYGVPHTKGQVSLVGGKEVDHALPSLETPYIMIMTSYMETTSSSQTARANEQKEMFLQVQASNIRYGTKRVFVNFVDGAGWLARRSDLRKMRDGCDHIINLTTLDQLEAIICKYVPETYFKVKRPQVEG